MPPLTYLAFLPSPTSSCRGWGCDGTVTVVVSSIDSVNLKGQECRNDRASDRSRSEARAYALTSLLAPLRPSCGSCFCWTSQNGIPRKLQRIPNLDLAVCDERGACSQLWAAFNQRGPSLFLEEGEGTPHRSEQWYNQGSLQLLMLTAMHEFERYICI